MVDISFNNGGSITIQNNGVTTRLIAFPADNDPITVEEVEVVGHQFTMNNELFRWRKPAAYIVRVSVYANSANDETLQKLLDATKHDTDEEEFVDWDKLEVEMTVLALKSRNGEKKQNQQKSGVADEYVCYRFSDGCILSGTPCLSVDSDGRIKAKRYAFVFGAMQRT